MSDVLIAGLGNIGSPLANLIVRLGVRKLVLVDRDRVELKNVTAQDYRPDDVGRPKAEAFAQRLRLAFPAVEIESWTCDLEDLPHGVVAVDVVLGALDSRRARQVLATELAGPLGVPVIDGGVGEDGRGCVKVLLPGAACLECGWSRADYRHLSQEYSCVPGAAVEAPPTGAPAFLGAAVASTMAAETQRLLNGDRAQKSFEIAFALTHRTYLTSRLRRNPHCLGCHEIVNRQVVLDYAATALDLYEAVRGSTEVGMPLHLECRRGLGPATEFLSGRLLDANWLREAGPTRLSDLGFDRRDLLRTRTPAGSFFVRFE